MAPDPPEPVDETVTLWPGERIYIRLPGRGTAGYRWTGHVDGDRDAVAVDVSAAPPEEIAGQPPGASVDEIATVEGRRAGRATVVLEQRRSWERRPEPLDRRVLHVVVA